jgi:hypothetical protein
VIERRSWNYPDRLCHEPCDLKGSLPLANAAVHAVIYSFLLWPRSTVFKQRSSFPVFDFFFFTTHDPHLWPWINSISSTQYKFCKLIIPTDDFFSRKFSRRIFFFYHCTFDHWLCSHNYTQTPSRRQYNQYFSLRALNLKMKMKIILIYFVAFKMRQVEANTQPEVNNWTIKFFNWIEHTNTHTHTHQHTHARTHISKFTPTHTLYENIIIVI